MARRARADPSPVRAGADCLAFQAGGERYALGLHAVQEITALGRVTPVPGAAPAIRGVMNLRGGVVAVVDVAARLGRPPAPASSRTALVVADARVEDAPTRVGLVVDAVDGILNLAPEDLLPPPARTLTAEPDLVVALARVEGRLVPVLDVDVLVAPARLRGARGTATPTRLPAPRRLSTPPARQRAPAPLPAFPRGAPSRPEEPLPAPGARERRGRYLGDPHRWPTIFEANRGRIDDPDLISPGQRLDIPAPR